MKRTIEKTLIFTALVFVMTLTGALLPLSDDTYIHVGDAAVYMAALLLPTPLACVASALGAGLCDLALGSAVYFIPTVIIKPLTVLAARGASRLSKDRATSDMLACLAGVVTVVGYLAADAVILLIRGQAVGGALDGIMFNFIQALGSAVVFMLVINAARGIIARARRKRQEKQNESAEI